MLSYLDLLYCVKYKLRIEYIENTKEVNQIPKGDSATMNSKVMEFRLILHQQLHLCLSQWDFFIFQ